MTIVTWHMQFGVGQTAREMASIAIATWTHCLNKCAQQKKHELLEEVAELRGQTAVCGEKES